MRFKKWLGVACTAVAMLAGAGCASETDANESEIAADQIVSNPGDSSWQYKSLVKLLQTGGLSKETLERYIEPTDGLLILDNPGAFIAVVQVASGEAANQVHSYNALGDLLGAGLRTEAPLDLAEPPRYSCDTDEYKEWDSATAATDETYGGGAAIDTSAVYVSRVSEFDGASRAILSELEWLGDDLNDEERAGIEARALAARETEQKILYAVSVPSKHLVLYFGLGDYVNRSGDTVQVWRLYVANIVTPCSA